MHIIWLLKWFKNKDIYKYLIIGSLVLMILIGLNWINHILQQKGKYKEQIKNYQAQITLLQKNEKKLLQAIEERNIQLSNVSKVVESKIKEFNKWKKLPYDKRYNDKIQYIKKTIDISKPNPTLEKCILVNELVSQLDYEKDF